MPLDLDKVLLEVSRFQKLKDCATEGDWTAYSAQPRYNIPPSVSNGEIGDAFSMTTRSNADAKFIAAAKNYDSVKVIRELVAALNNCYEKCALIAEDTDHQVGSTGCDDQLGDSFGTANKISKAIRDQKTKE